MPNVGIKHVASFSEFLNIQEAQEAQESNLHHLGIKAGSQPLLSSLPEFGMRDTSTANYTLGRNLTPSSPASDDQLPFDLELDEDSMPDFDVGSVSSEELGPSVFFQSQASRAPFHSLTSQSVPTSNAVVIPAPKRRSVCFERTDVSSYARDLAYVNRGSSGRLELDGGMKYRQAQAWSHELNFVRTSLTLVEKDISIVCDVLTESVFDECIAGSEHRQSAIFARLREAVLDIQLECEGLSALQIGRALSHSALR